MGGVSLDFSKAQPITQQPQSAVTLDFSKAQPIPSAPAEKPGFFHELAAQFGMSPEQLQADQDERNAHPVKNALKTLIGGPGGQVLESLYNQGKVSVKEIGQAIHEAANSNPNAAVQHAVGAVPIVGPALIKAAQQAPASTGNYVKDVGNVVTDPGTMGTLVGAAAQAAPIAAGAIEKVPGGSEVLSKVAAPVQAAADVAARVPAAAAQGAARAGRALYPKNVSIPQQQIAAQNLVKALVPDVAAIPNVKSAASVIPDALASAENNGTAINGKLDMQKVLEYRAAEVQGHYNDVVLKPNAGDLNKVPDNYNGDTTTSGRATLGQMNDRVNDINSELKSNFRKKLASQTTEANASDADLIAEKQALTNILHTRLAQLTGLEPQQIADLRQNAGKLRSLAQEVGVSADKDTIVEGRADTTGGTSSLKNPLERPINKLSGGQEVIGNRVFKDALKNFKPVENPLPQPKAPGPGVATTPEAAQQEFLRAQQLEQASQDSAAGRRQATQTYRAEQTAGQQGLAQQEVIRQQQLDNAAQDASAERGKTADAIRDDNRANGASKWASQGYTKVVQHLANDASSGIARADLVKLAQTPQGNSLLTRASSLTPGSPAMRSIVQKIAAAIAGKS